MSDAKDPADAGMDNPPETTSDDLIERLRDFEMVNHSLHDELPELLIAAASRLAALQQRVEELERQRDGNTAWRYRFKLQQRAEAAEARERALRQRVDELERELKVWRSV